MHFLARKELSTEYLTCAVTRQIKNEQTKRIMKIFLVSVMGNVSLALWPALVVLGQHISSTHNAKTVRSNPIQDVLQPYVFYLSLPPPDRCRSAPVIVALKVFLFCDSLTKGWYWKSSPRRFNLLANTRGVWTRFLWPVREHRLVWSDRTGTRTCLRPSCMHIQ